MKWKIGDRFRDTSIMKLKATEWEITGPENKYHEYPSICIKGNNGWRIGEEREWSFHLEEEFWEYIGNFNKDTNFNTLYDILNGRD